MNKKSKKIGAHKRAHSPPKHKFIPYQVEEMHREAINNVRRTRGKVRFEDILTGYYDD